MAKGGHKPPTSSGSNIPAPTGLAATATSATSIHVTWNAVTNATSYWVWRNGQVYAIVTGLEITDSYAIPSTTYIWTVAAVVNSVLGTKSAGVSVTTPAS